jgi:type IV pilus assembly protein PilM
MMRDALSRLTGRSLPIGIDIGASGAKLVQLTASMGRLGLGGLARVDLPEDASPDPSARMDTLIREICEKAGSPAFGTRRCVVSVDDELLRVRSVRLPKMSPEELRRVVELDGASQLGFPDREEAVIGWASGPETSPTDGSRQEVMYIGAPAEPLEHLADGLAHGGLTPLAIEPGFIALARCFGRRLRRASDQNVVRLVLDVGRRKTAVVFTRGDAVSFYKALEFGGRDITQAAAQRLGMEPATIADLRGRRATARAQGLEPPDPKVDRAMYEAIRPLLEEIAHEANLCLRHYVVTYRGARPVSCVLAGGDASEPGLEQIVAEMLHLETSIARPLEDVDLREDVHGHRADTGQLAAWSIATGLSLQPFHHRSTGKPGVTRRSIDRPRRERASPAPEGAAREEIREAA